MRHATKTVLIRFTPEELAAIDRLRASTARGSWIKALCRDAVRARDAFGRACGLKVVVDDPDAPAPDTDPEAGPLVPHETDAQIVRVTGHVQPCRCVKCRPMRRRLRGWG